MRKDINISKICSNFARTNVLYEFKGKWEDENVTAEEFVQEIRRNREQNITPVVEL